MSLLLLSLLACSEHVLKDVPPTPEVTDDSDAEADADTDADADSDTDADTDTDTDTDTDADTDTTAPEIEVSPLVLEYGYNPFGATPVRSFQVANLGDADLDVTGIQVVGSSSFGYFGLPSFTVAPGGSVLVEIEHLADGNDHHGLVEVASNDADEPSVLVSLEADGARPDLVVSPPVVDYGLRDLTCVGDEIVTLTNEGAAPLTVTSIDLLEPAFSIVSAPATPFVLAPAASETVEVRYEAAAVGPAAGSLRVSSDDPDGLEVAELEGEGSVRDGLATLTIADDPQVDILFLVDQSGSMDDDSAAMAGALDDFLLALDSQGLDWRVGVTTLDNGQLNRNFNNVGWFDATYADPNDDFLDAVTLGTQNSGVNFDTERLFTLAGASLFQTGAGGLNDGFLRSGASLHLVMVSDEEEQSNTTPYDDEADALAVFAAYADEVVVDVVANLTTCGTPSGDIILTSVRYQEIAQLSGGLILDICDADWGSQMSTLGASLQAPNDIALTGDPDAATLAVTVDGNVLASNEWTYDPLTNSVTPTVPLPAGTVVEVTWQELPTCP